MSKMLAKTRGNSSPQGKPHVYFCAHPDDYSLYFETISNEILKFHNCAIYYDTEPTKPYVEEDFFLSLSQMQLFVMPITKKLLIDDNRAVEVELKYAIEHHIPVLPLMQESGLDELYSEKFGDLQYLTNLRKDATEIPYEKKLEKYLCSVLVGDELAAKVRAAFDAYIFLSYRKKDRKYAQELMRLIHKNEFCRDIAIWYDEFLTPGENFNDAIGEALKKSKLFALTVTPNLVNEQNYVMTTEYPMAIEAQKSVLPIEMVETDRTELEKNYTDIPECAKCDDEESISASLLKHLGDIAIKENNDPQHNFFIGLAYLSGIDVEVNHDTALKLITSSAEGGCVEAMEKLVSIYENSRRHTNAAEWQLKLSVIKKENFEKEETEENGIEYIRSMLKFISFLNKGGCVDGKNAKKEGELLLEFCFMLDKRLDTIEIKKCIVSCYISLSETDDAKQAKKQKEYLKTALRFCADLTKHNKNSELLCELAKCYQLLAQITNTKFKKRHYYKKAVAVLEELPNEVISKTLLYNFSDCYKQLAIIGRGKGVTGTAYKNCNLWLNICKGMVDEEGTSEVYLKFLIQYKDMGNTFELAKKYMVADKCYACAEDMAKELAKTQKSKSNMLNIAEFYTTVGDAMKERKNYGAAEAYYKDALNIYNGLGGDVDVRKRSARIYKALYSIANNASEKENYKSMVLSIYNDIAAAEKETCKYTIFSIYANIADITGITDIADALNSMEKMSLLASAHFDFGDVITSFSIMEKLIMKNIVEPIWNVTRLRSTYPDEKMIIECTRNSEIHGIKRAQDRLLRICEDIAKRCYQKGDIANSKKFFSLYIKGHAALANIYREREFRVLYIAFEKCAKCIFDPKWYFSKQYVWTELAYTRSASRKTILRYQKKAKKIWYEYWGTKYGPWILSAVSLPILLLMKFNNVNILGIDIVILMMALYVVCGIVLVFGKR